MLREDTESCVIDPSVQSTGLRDVELPGCTHLGLNGLAKTRIVGIPFQLGTTSYIYPADVLPNVERLAGLVDDIELVFYEVTALSPLPDAETLAALHAIGVAHDMSFTVHLPLNLSLASGDLIIREGSLELAKRVIAAARVLDPWGYIIHVEHGAVWPGSWDQWERLAGAALSQLVQYVGDGALLCLENTESVPPELVFAVAKRLRTSVCLDAGHLFKTARNPLPYLEQVFPRVRVVHLHGWDGKNDHRSLDVMADRELRSVVEWLYRSAYAGVVTLEVFNEWDWLSSIACLAQLLETEVSDGTDEWDGTR